MAVWLKIYITGFIIAMFLCVRVMEEDGRITFSEILIAFFMALLSWCTVFGLWVGANLRKDN
jgi:hypothetical protein